MQQIKFGTVTTTVKYADGKPVSQKVTQHPSVKILDEQEALTEFLKQLDLYKRGLIADFGITCYVDKSTNKIYRVEPWYDAMKELN